MNTVGEYLADKYPFWDKLTDDEKNQLAEGCQITSFERGQQVHRGDEKCRGAMLVRRGQLRAYILSDNGRDVTLYRIREGEHCVLAASCLMDSIAFDVMIEAIEDTEVLLLPVTLLHRLMEENSEVGLFLYKESTERFSDVMWTMQQILFLGADTRVANFLWDEAVHGGDTIHMTHDEIARLIGSAREVVSKILKMFEEEGIVELGRGSIRIKDRDGLRKLTE